MLKELISLLRKAKETADDSDQIQDQISKLLEDDSDPQLLWSEIGEDGKPINAAQLKVLHAQLAQAMFELGYFGCVMEISIRLAQVSIRRFFQSALAGGAHSEAMVFFLDSVDLNTKKLEKNQLLNVAKLLKAANFQLNKTADKTVFSIIFSEKFNTYQVDESLKYSEEFRQRLRDSVMLGLSLENEDDLKTSKTTSVLARLAESYAAIYPYYCLFDALPFRALLEAGAKLGTEGAVGFLSYFICNPEQNFSGLGLPDIGNQRRRDFTIVHAMNVINLLLAYEIITTDHLRTVLMGVEHYDPKFRRAPRGINDEIVLKYIAELDEVNVEKAIQKLLARVNNEGKTYGFIWSRLANLSQKVGKYEDAFNYFTNASSPDKCISLDPSSKPIIECENSTGVLLKKGINANYILSATHLDVSNELVKLLCDWSENQADLPLSLELSKQVRKIPDEKLTARSHFYLAMYYCNTKETELTYYGKVDLILWHLSCVTYGKEKIEAEYLITKLKNKEHELKYALAKIHDSDVTSGQKELEIGKLLKEADESLKNIGREFLNKLKNSHAVNETVHPPAAVQLPTLGM